MSHHPSVSANKARLEANKKNRLNPFYPEEEDRKMLEYLAERSLRAELPCSMTLMWKDFQKHRGTRRTVSGLRARFRRTISLTIHKATKYDVETRVRMLFMSNSPVDKDFLKEIRRNATVTLDNFGTIVQYTAHRENGLQLHAPSKKAVNEKENRDLGDQPPPNRPRMVEDLDFDSENDDVIYDGPDDVDFRPQPIQMMSGSFKSEVHRNQQQWAEGDADFEPIEEEQTDFTEYKPFHRLIPPPAPAMAIYDAPALPHHHPLTPEDVLNSNSNFDLHSGQNDAESIRNPTVPCSSTPNAPTTEMGEFMMVMKDFVATQTLWIKGQMKDPTPAPPSSYASSSVSQPIGPQTSSKKGFLHLLKSLVLGLDRPEFEPLRARISRELVDIGDGDEKLAVDTISKLINGVMDGIDKSG